jgi:hypothetical protein
MLWRRRRKRRWRRRHTKYFLCGRFGDSWRGRNVAVSITHSCQEQEEEV